MTNEEFYTPEEWAKIDALLIAESEEAFEYMMSFADKDLGDTDGDPVR